MSTLWLIQRVIDEITDKLFKELKKRDVGGCQDAYKFVGLASGVSLTSQAG